MWLQLRLPLPEKKCERLHLQQPNTPLKMYDDDFISSRSSNEQTTNHFAIYHHHNHFGWISEIVSIQISPSVNSFWFFSFRLSKNIFFHRGKNLVNRFFWPKLTQGEYRLHIWISECILQKFSSKSRKTGEKCVYVSCNTELFKFSFVYIV